MHAARPAALATALRKAKLGKWEVRRVGKDGKGELGQSVLALI